MTAAGQGRLRRVATALRMAEDDLRRQGLRSVLTHQLRTVKTAICARSGRYGVSSAEAMEARSRDGTLEEADAWQDVPRLDRLESTRDGLMQLLERLV